MPSPLIIESENGYSPSLELIRRLQEKARMMGLICEWPVVQAFNNGDLVLNLPDGSTGPNQADKCIIAARRNGGWKFYTETEYDLLEEKRNA